MKNKKVLFISISVLAICLIGILNAFAHSGRTDSSGGHRDNKNQSGLGYYHYHCGGYPAHLHSGGVCPYKTKTYSSNIPASKPVSTPSPTPSPTPDLYEEGFDDGYNKGYDEGYTTGLDEGYDKGYSIGHSIGYDEGLHKTTGTLIVIAFLFILVIVIVIVKRRK